MEDGTPREQDVLKGLYFEIDSSQIPEFVGKKVPQRYLPLIILATVTVYIYHA